MRVQVLFFGGLREALGTGVVDLSFDHVGRPGAVVDAFPHGLALGEVEQRLVQLYPRFALFRSTVRVAVNEVFLEAADPALETQVSDGDVVAYIPPVSGG